MAKKWREVEPDCEDLRMVEKVIDCMAYYRGDVPMRIGIFGLDFQNNQLQYLESVYMNDVQDGNFKNNSDRRVSSYCGFSNNFLSNSREATHQNSSLRYNHRVPRDPPLKAAPRTVESHAEKAARRLEEQRKVKEKAEKKRLKKLKQKQRKRLEKEKENAVKHVPVNGDSAESTGTNRPNKDSPSTGATEGKQDTSGDSDSSDNSDSDEDSSEDEENEAESSNSEELDMNSCFVDIAKRKLVQKPKPVRKEAKVQPTGQQKDKSNQGQKELIKDSAASQDSAIPSTEDMVKRSTELAVIGNQFASSGRFDMAVKYFTDAIKHNPQEFRLFGNRSFCFEKMQEYERALTDAELSLNMSPGWVKGLYRKGRALAGLKRYDEAIQALREVLQQDGSCADAAQELMRVQITQLMEFGFSREQSSNALILHGTAEKALEALSQMSGILYEGSLPTACPSHPAKVESVSKTPTAASTKPKPQPQVQDTPKPEPQPHDTPKPQAKAVMMKPEIELCPIWVGNLVPSVTETMIENVFSGFGVIHSVKLLPARRCAFVNYHNQASCKAAIRSQHGRVLEGTKIFVRYPDRIPPHLRISKAAHQAVDMSSTDTKGQRECFFWRNLGCNRRPACSFLHIPEHKGIDRVKGRNSDK